MVLPVHRRPCADYSRLHQDSTCSGNNNDQALWDYGGKRYIKAAVLLLLLNLLMMMMTSDGKAELAENPTER